MEEKERMRDDDDDVKEEDCCTRLPIGGLRCNWRSMVGSTIAVLFTSYNNTNFIAP